MSKKTFKVYIDISIGAKPAGRICFELFKDLTPKTAENFKALCTGEYGKVGLGSRTQKLHYINVKFHRIIDGFVIQGGDITNQDGSGGYSIYGPTFADENFQRKHSCAGLLSMANRGRNTNSSQFFITLKAAPHLDNKHVVFGQVIEGMDVVRKIAKVPTNLHDKPRIPVLIVDSGELDDPKNFLRYDPFSKSAFEENQNENVKVDKEEEEEQVNKNQETSKDQVQVSSEENKESENKGINIPISSKFSQKSRSRLEDLKMRINEARTLNNKAVLDEEKQQVDPNYVKNKKREELQQRNKEIKEDLEFKGISENKYYLNETALKQEFLEGNKKKKKYTFGWDVFNEDTLYAAYKKRCSNLKFYQDIYEKQQENPNETFVPKEEQLDNLTQDLEQQAEKRSKFSRRRKFLEEEDVNYINERNRNYNKKLQRHFGEYAAEIKNNLEKGTAN